MDNQEIEHRQSTLTEVPSSPNPTLKSQLDSIFNGPFPPQLQKWNWGAFSPLTTLTWGLHFGVWEVFYFFIPFYNIYNFFYLGAHGNSLAWQRRKFAGVEEFESLQKPWKIFGIIGLVFTILYILFLLIYLIGILILIHTSLFGGKAIVDTTYVSPDMRLRDLLRRDDLYTISIQVDDYAKSHHGDYPTDLSQIKGVTLPGDPLTDKTYGYVLNSSNFVLSATFENANDPLLKNDANPSNGASYDNKYSISSGSGSFPLESSGSSKVPTSSL